MDLSHPIRGIIPTLDAPVLEVLAGTTRGLSGREVHRLAGTGSVRGVQLVLARLVAQGLVSAEEHASATLYAANRAHLAWPALEDLIGLRRHVLDQIRAAVAGWTIAPLHVSLFGSAARREGNAGSDIDLLIIRPDALAEGDEVWQTQIDALRDRLLIWTGNRCQAFDIDRARLGAHVATDDPLVENWLSDGVPLAGESLRSLVDGLEPAIQQ
ncbi:MAG: nucleotidyltransferase domain-containing protein [Chloroflexi bacterium]|nr:nucleotidyltransferase domain-containing protein [Chloroflexota bacterium]